MQHSGNLTMYMYVIYEDGGMEGGREGGRDGWISVCINVVKNLYVSMFEKMKHHCLRYQKTSGC